MRLLYPSNPLRKRIPDDQYWEETEAASDAGFDRSVFSFEDFQEGLFRANPDLVPDNGLLYRGWMLSGDEYTRLAALVAGNEGRLQVTVDRYLAHHHLPRWYPIISDLTPETRVFAIGSDLESELRSLGWDGYFIKDYVKSLKTSVGSKITSPSQIGSVISEMERTRGIIEGGICVRMLEDFDPDTERRYFAINGRAYAEVGEVPAIVDECARRFPADFISIDAVQRRNGTHRIVEIGDGQVSDLVGWTPGRFVRLLKEHWTL